MKKRSWMILVVCASCVTHAAPLNEREAGLVKARLVPAPKRVELGDGPEVVLDDALAVTLSCAKESDLARKQVRAMFKAWFGCRPEVSVAAPGDAAPRLADAYRIAAERRVAD